MRFQYNNLMYMTAGYLVGRLAGSTWEEELRTSILEPLQVTRSGFSLQTLEADADHASAYQLDEAGQLISGRHEAAEVIGPAGSIDSTARDLANYLRMLYAYNVHDEFYWTNVQTTLRPFRDSPECRELTVCWWVGATRLSA